MTNDRVGNRSRTGVPDAAPEPGGEPAGAVGKRTRTEALPMVQRAAVAPEPPGAQDDGAIHAAASRGIATPASPLPYRDQIQRLFGHHDISSVQAHTGTDAAASAQDMGARAYATGDHVVLGASADLHTVAHEAAHTVQQRGGVQLKGGVGAEGDAHEQHADEVADRVVRGESAEPVLDRYAGGGSASSRPDAVQRRIDGYGPGRLRSNTIVLRGVTDTQRQQLQALHDDPHTTYTVDQARQRVGAPPLGTGTASGTGHAPPFPFRYGQSGPSTMTTVQDDGAGLVQMPSASAMETENAEPQISVVSGSTYADLQHGGHRAISQAAVMENVSPNAAARALGFATPTPLSWEWLHLVAFSIGETHVGQLSPASRQLIQRTDQPQQIRENLVLGTAAANTAMLSWETSMKRTMQAHPDWRLSLFVAARKETRQVTNSRGAQVSIPVATSIEYHFQFTTGTGHTTAPVILRFNTQSHERPTLSEFHDVVRALEQNVRPAVDGTAAHVTPHGIDTTRMHAT